MNCWKSCGKACVPTETSHTEAKYRNALANNWRSWFKKKSDIVQNSRNLTKRSVV